MTLFCLMVVNNWFIIADGFLRASGSKWSCLFFVLVNLVLLNILVALIIDCFAALQEEQDVGPQPAAPREVSTASFLECDSLAERQVSIDEQVENAVAASPNLRRRGTSSMNMLRRVLLADDDDLPLTRQCSS